MSSTDGKHLEGLVAFVESVLLPEGFNVKTNKQVFNDEGVQIAEFDIEIRGKVGSTSIAWLIECRDRPGSGPAPGAWVEQLVGRRSRFGFNKVTAVSTTGFAPGAIKFAKEQGIEMRAVTALRPEEFDWLVLKHLEGIVQSTNLRHATMLMDEAEPSEKVEAASQMILGARGEAKFLRSIKTNSICAPSDAFLGAVVAENLFEKLAPIGQGRAIKLHARYTNDEDHFVVDTEKGPVRIVAIHFEGDLTVAEQLVPLEMTAEYRQVDTGELISQIASYAPQAVRGSTFTVELHRLADTGETHVLVKRVPKPE
jgi:hypothetical protein